jgi:hypothetical protein
VGLEIKFRANVVVIEKKKKKKKKEKRKKEKVAAESNPGRPTRILSLHKTQRKRKQHEF